MLSETCFKLSLDTDSNKNRNFEKHILTTSFNLIQTGEPFWGCLSLKKLNNIKTVKAMTTNLANFP